MRRERKTIRQTVIQSGANSDRVCVNVGVHFDLVDAQELVDGVPDLKFSVGNRRMANDAKTRVASLRSPDAMLKPAGCAIQTTILLSGPNTFTLMSIIKEIQMNKADMPA